MSDTDSIPQPREGLMVSAVTPAESSTPARSETPKAPPTGSGLAWLWAGIGLTLVILAGGFVGWLLMVRPVEKAASGLRDTVAGALERITGERFAVSSNTVTLQKSNIAELNVVQRKTQTVTKFETSQFGSTATLILRGDFAVKAGYDLSQPFSVTVNETTGEVLAEFPPAKITSVEMKNYEVFFSDSGLIHKLKPEHVELATKQMLAQARLDAEKSDIKQEADAQLQTRLKDLLGRDAKKVMVRDTQVLP
ncbi:MAG: DUF4230 domain-containing protein [Verrucomicrobiales bacterium]